MDNDVALCRNPRERVWKGGYTVRDWQLGCQQGADFILKLQNLAAALELRVAFCFVFVRERETASQVRYTCLGLEADSPQSPHGQGWSLKVFNHWRNVYDVPCFLEVECSSSVLSRFRVR